ncbi:MAG: DUF1801 domain-containing protein [Gemmatimonadetes bacterium]|nr:DUF1801 domain-containing protein [Gemmatimonadota bacterium]
MVSSSATSPEQYLSELPEERRTVVAAVRDTILRNLPEGYRESMSWGMLSYEIPLERYRNTYNKQPLGYAALAAQKNGYSLYLTCVYSDAEQERRLREGFAAAGKKLNMGKSCVRFKRLDDLPLELIGELIASTPPDQFIARYEASRGAKS